MSSVLVTSLKELQECEEVCHCGTKMYCETTNKHTWQEEDSPEYIVRLFKILICYNCNSPAVILYTREGCIYADQEDELEAKQYGEPPSNYYERIVLYGSKRNLHHSIPLAISDIVNQAEAVLGRSPRASFILCRAVLEEVCNNFGIATEGVNRKGKPYSIKLSDRLTELFEKEQLSEELKTIVDGIRDLGNEGAHSEHQTFTKKVKTEEAEVLLELVNFILERLYVDKYRQREATEKFERLKRSVLPPGS